MKEVSAGYPQPECIKSFSIYSGNFFLGEYYFTHEMKSIIPGICYSQYKASINIPACLQEIFFNRCQPNESAFISVLYPDFTLPDFNIQTARLSQLFHFPYTTNPAFTIDFTSVFPGYSSSAFSRQFMASSISFRLRT